MNARNVHHRLLRAARRARAFTLVEMLICVGAVALIAVGLGKLFSSTGQTVKIGKSISDMNEAAAMLERRIRQDVASISRAGPLVIRNKLITDPSDTASANQGVYLSSDMIQLSARPRRADEIGFMAQGRFVSAREPMWPGRAPGSSTAWITIGHGMRRDSSIYHAPALDDDPLNTSNGTWPAGLGQRSPSGQPGPNEFASDWILLRHVTVLARPQWAQSLAPLPTPDYLGATNIPSSISQGWKDSYTQIDLQPAAASLFRFDPAHPSWTGASDMRGFGYETTPALQGNGLTQPGTAQQLPLPSASQWARAQETPVWPSPASGIVDLATIDPSMIRTRILGEPRRLPILPNPANNPFFTPTMQITLLTPVNQLNSSNVVNVGPTFNSAHAMKLLMAAMLPGNDPWIYGGSSVAQPSVPLGGGQEQRMICAPVPPDFAGTLDPNPSDRTMGQAYLNTKPYRQQDQAMLSASNLVVGCSEFIVEWSFGDVYPTFDLEPTPRTSTGPAGPPGTIIWHGMIREQDSSHVYAAPYRGEVKHTPSNWATQYQNLGCDAYVQAWTRLDGSPSPRFAPSPPAAPNTLQAVPTALIHWPANANSVRYGPGANGAIGPNPNVPLYSFFGYLDPTYTQQSGLDPNTLDWPWPKLLRFTIGLTDPSDPNVERTYQFIVDLTTADQGQ